MNKREIRRRLPAGPRVPSWYQMASTWLRPGASVERLRGRYGRRVTVQLPLQPPMVILSDPGDIKELFTAPPDVLHPGEGARILEPIVGRNSVILLDEEPHLQQRKLMLPAFHGERMQGLRGLMEQLTREELDTWPSDEPVKLHPRLQRLTLEIILRAVFGLDRGDRLDHLRDRLTALLVFGESPLSVIPAAERMARFIGPMRRFHALRDEVDGLVFGLIDERRAEDGADGARERGDVLAMLLAARHDDDSPMSAQEIRDELMTALLAGHETTASELAWGFERLARTSRVQERLATEVREGDDDAYLTATVNEILRLRPVLPNAEPRLVKRPVTIGGREYPPGVLLLASAWLVHHDPEIYPDPFAFRPERFLGTAPGTYTWLPFGGGRRRCLGASFALQEMKIVLAEALRRFAVLPHGPAAERTARRSITFSPARGATVILRPRESVEDPDAATADSEVSETSLIG